VGISFSGDIHIDCLVSQGCRAVGDTFVVTKGHQNIIEQLDGKPALVAIEEMVQGLPLLDRQLLATGGLQVGRVIDQGKGNYGKGDFLIRSLVGVRRETGAVLIGDLVRAGQTLQFHVRDARTADEEMRLLLEGEPCSVPRNSPGALLVTCNGRGRAFSTNPTTMSNSPARFLAPCPSRASSPPGNRPRGGAELRAWPHGRALALFRIVVKWSSG